MISQSRRDDTPKNLIIGPYLYSVEFDGDESYLWDRLGTCHFRARKIVLDDKPSDTAIPQTLMHEVLHALGHAFEIPYWTQHQEGDKHDLMSSALVMFIRNNKPFIQWILETDPSTN